MGIRVSLIEPGAIDTPIWNKALAEADRLNRESHPETLKLYSKLVTKVRAEAEKSAAKAISAEVVARAVEHAVTARRPKIRYLIGRDAKFNALLSTLPDRWKDWLILSGL